MGKCALLVCLFFLERGSDAPSTLAVRRRRRRSSLCLLSTGSPFGHHPRLSMVRLRRRREWICAVAQCLQCDAAGVGVLSILFSTGSPFGHHPRLSMVRLRRRREWICAVAQRLQCDAARGESISVWMLLKRRGGESVYRLYTICKNRGRRSSG